MHLTKPHLKKIILEEIKILIQEQYVDWDKPAWSELDPPREKAAPDPRIKWCQDNKARLRLPWVVRPNGLINDDCIAAYANKKDLKAGREQLRKQSSPWAIKFANMIHGEDPAGLLELARQVASFFDYTGILTWPDVARAFKTLKADASLSNTGWFLLALAAAIPVAGKAAKMAKGARGAKEVKQVEQATKAVEAAAEAVIPALRQSVGRGAKLAQKISNELQDTLKLLRRYATFGPSNLLIPRDYAKKLWNLAKAGKLVKYAGRAYRGVAVTGPTHLVDMLKIGGKGIGKYKVLHPDVIAKGGLGIANPAFSAGVERAATAADKYFKKYFQRAWNSKGKWVEIPIPHANTKVIASISDEGLGFASWSSKKGKAEAVGYAGVTEKNRWEVLFVSDRGGKFVDVRKSLKGAPSKIVDDAMSPHRGQNISATWGLASKTELVGIGNVPINKIFVRRIPSK